MLCELIATYTACYYDVCNSVQMGYDVEEERESTGVTGRLWIQKWG